MKFRVHDIQKRIESDVSLGVANNLQGISDENIHYKLVQPPVSKWFVKSWEVGFLWL